MSNDSVQLTVTPDELGIIEDLPNDEHEHLCALIGSGADPNDEELYQARVERRDRIEQLCAKVAES